MERVRREKFRDNNARVLRAVNALRERYIKAKDLEYGLGAEISAVGISDCLNYLNESGFIKRRTVEGHTEIADLICIFQEKYKSDPPPHLIKNVRRSVKNSKGIFDLAMSL